MSQNRDIEIIRAAIADGDAPPAQLAAYRLLLAIVEESDAVIEIALASQTNALAAQAERMPKLSEQEIDEIVNLYMERADSLDASSYRILDLVHDAYLAHKVSGANTKTERRSSVRSGESADLSISPGLAPEPGSSLTPGDVKQAAYAILERAEQDRISCDEMAGSRQTSSEDGRAAPLLDSPKPAIGDLMEEIQKWKHHTSNALAEIDRLRLILSSYYESPGNLTGLWHGRQSL